MSSEQVDSHVRAWFLDRLAAEAARDRAAAWARVRLLLVAVAAGVVSGVAGGCVASFLLRAR